MPLWLFKRKDTLPVVLHAHHGPVFGFRFVEAFVELADVRFAVVSILALGIGVVAAS